MHVGPLEENLPAKQPPNQRRPPENQPEDAMPVKEKSMDADSLRQRDPDNKAFPRTGAGGEIEIKDVTNTNSSPKSFIPSLLRALSVWSI